MTVRCQKRYRRLFVLFARWCAALGLPVRFEYAQLSSWAWYYSQRFTQRSLPGHWSAFRFCADADGLDFPRPTSLTWRRMTRVMRALRLRDPSVEKRCYPLVWSWLRRMLAVDGITDVSMLFAASFCLYKLVFWSRVLVAHCAMMRACEHASGMCSSDLSVVATPPSLASAGFWPNYFVLSVGSLPPDLQPRLASNRKLKLRPARSSILPVWFSLESAGLWVFALTRRLRLLDHPDALLFPNVIDGVVSPRPLAGKYFLKRLRLLATGAGMPAAEVTQLEQRSLRAGGCTDAFARAMPRASIQRQGGWTSDAVDIYDRPSQDLSWQSFATFWTDC